MPQNADLYGQRPAKKQKRELALSDTLDFAAQLRTVMATKKPKPTAQLKAAAPKRSLALSGPDKSKKASDHERDGRDRIKKHSSGKAHKALRLKSPPPDSAAAGLDAAERERIRRNMEAKARRYAALQRGDYVARDGEAAPLVDFDRKWAERRECASGSGSDSDNGSDDSSGNGSGSDNERSGSDSNQADLVEVTDEFGRTRQMTRAAADRAARLRARAQRATEELGELRARPVVAPDAHIIHGDIIQTQAISSGLAGGRRPPTAAEQDSGGEETHYRGDAEDVRTRGAAYYRLAADDESTRTAQMQALADQRAATEAARSQLSADADARRAQVDARRAQLEARRAELVQKKAAQAQQRAQRLADSFLDGLAQDLLGSADGEDGGDGDGGDGGDGGQGSGRSVNASTE